MVDPISIITGIITVYSVACQLKKIKDSYISPAAPPNVIVDLENRCKYAARVLMHTQGRLDDYRNDMESSLWALDREKHEDTNASIEESLNEVIAKLLPQVGELKAQLARYGRASATNWEYYTSIPKRNSELANLKELDATIERNLGQFGRLLTSWDGANTDWIQKHCRWMAELMLMQLPAATPLERRASLLSQLSYGSGSNDCNGVPGSPLSPRPPQRRRRRPVRSPEAHGILMDAIAGRRGSEVALILRALRVDPNWVPPPPELPTPTPPSRGSGSGAATAPPSPPPPASPLHVAAELGDLLSMRALLRHGADIGARGDRGRTALHVAALIKRDAAAAEAVALLLDAGGADLADAEDADGRTALWQAAWRGDRPRVLAVLMGMRSGAVEAAEGEVGEGGSRRGSAATAAATVPRAVDVDRRCGDRSIPTALWAAATSGAAHALDSLLAAGARPDAARDVHGRTLLHAAAAGLVPHPERVVKKLLERGADVLARNPPLPPAMAALTVGFGPDGKQIMGDYCESPGMSLPLHFAAVAPGKATIAAAAATAAATNKAGSRAEPSSDPRKEARRWRTVVDELIKRMEELGADLDIEDGAGATAMLRAAQFGSLVVVRCLAEAAARARAREWAKEKERAKDKEVEVERPERPKTPESMADVGASDGASGSTSGTSGTSDWCRNNGSDRESDYACWSARDRRGNRPLYYACANGHLAVAVFLIGLGADINEKNEQHETPLRAATRWRRIEVVNMLLDLGAET